MRVKPAAADPKLDQARRRGGPLGQCAPGLRLKSGISSH